MEEEVFSASSKEKIVKALGVALNCNVEDIHVYVNGVDITKTVLLEEVRLTIVRKGA